MSGDSYRRAPRRSAHRQRKAPPLQVIRVQRNLVAGVNLILPSEPCRFTSLSSLELMASQGGLLQARAGMRITPIASQFGLIFVGGEHRVHVSIPRLLEEGQRGPRPPVPTREAGT